MGRYISVDVDVDAFDVLDALDDEVLIKELESRGLGFNTKFVSGDTTRELLTKIWYNKRLGKDFESELDQLIYYSLGKTL